MGRLDERNCNGVKELSANVWFEEVSTGLINELKNTIRMKDESGVLVPLPDNAFVVREPEEDFKFETFPCVSIYNINDDFNPLRYDPEPVEIARNEEEHYVTLEDHAVSFDLDYQIDFWAKYQSDIDTMTRTWLIRHFRDFNLPVIDDGGVERTCNVFTNGKLYRSDLLQDENRLFHAFIKYRIWVEIDDENQYNKYMVIQRNFDIQEKT